ncbi:MAG: ABC transporter substrate-binding protein [Candidatus Accumulibacter sp.]|jgi:peptide/nickel transport system substrate-binding protein|nr:ABC transporter substrate-binding protein [Accumulibacter sp.]
MNEQDFFQLLTRQTQLSRRAFITGALAAGFTLTTAQSLWAQTGGSRPKKGGHLKAGIAPGQASDTLEPFAWGEPFMISVGFAVWGGLVEYGADGLLKPDIAESWEHNGDATRWIFTLRKGVTFSNGKTLTAEDVVNSLNTHRGADSKSGAKAVFENVDGIKADGDNKIIITLKSAAVEFPYLLTDFHLTIAPAKDGKPDYLSGIGAGPYTLESFKPGARVELKRNPNSHRQPWFDSAELICLPDDVARQSALVSGAVDIINRPDLKTVDLLARQKGLKVDEVVGRRHYWLTTHTQREPFSNKDLRLAVKYGLDRAEILNLVYRGHGAIGNDQPITPAYKFHDASLQAKAFDPDKARFHLKKAGLESLDVEFVVSEVAFDGAVDLITVYQKNAAKAGINIKIRKESIDGYWDIVHANQPNWYATWWSGRPTEDGMLTAGYSETSPWNYGHWLNDRFNQLLKDARSEVNDEKRKQLYFELQHIVSDDSGVVIPVFANTLQARSEKIGVPEKLGTGLELDDGRYLERWWRNA